jgi:polar amino acid transport system substrate-binding protein
MEKTSLLLIVIAFLVCVSCKPKVEPLTILTENYPPLSYMENGVVTGYGADVVAAMQKELGTDYKPVLMNWDEAYEKALREPNVVLFTMEKTPARDGKFFFVGPLGANTSSFYALKDNPIKLDEVEQARQVAAIATTSEWFTEQYLEDLGFKNLTSTPNPLDNFALLNEKKADLAVFTDITYQNLAMAAGVNPDDYRPVKELMSTEYYIAISRQTDIKTVQLWEQVFAQLQKYGTINALKDKWFPAAEKPAGE